MAGRPGYRIIHDLCLPVSAVQYLPTGDQFVLAAPATDGRALKALANEQLYGEKALSLKLKRPPHFYERAHTYAYMH